VTINAPKAKHPTDMVVGTWNTRQIGSASANFDPFLQTATIFQQIEQWGWHIAMLSDVEWESGVIISYRTKAQTWTIVVHGKVAIAMNELTANKWREGGSIWNGGPSTAENAARTMSVTIPKRGWRTGVHTVAVYAPTSSPAQSKQRAKFLKEVRKQRELAPSQTMVFVGGDWNAQVGCEDDESWAGILGTWGNPRVNKVGSELRGWCLENDVLIANTFRNSQSIAPGGTIGGAQDTHSTI
jgi:hypothetical protein